MRKKKLTSAERRAAEKAEMERWDASVVSNDSPEHACKGCKEKRVIFQTHDFKARRMIARCKSCLVRMFGNRIYVQPVETWKRDALKIASEAQQRAFAARRSKKHLEGLQERSVCPPGQSVQPTLF